MIINQLLILVTILFCIEGAIQYHITLAFRERPLSCLEEFSICLLRDLFVVLLRVADFVKAISGRQDSIEGDPVEGRAVLHHQFGECGLA